MGRQTNIAAGAIGAGVVAAGLGAAYIVHRAMANANAPQQHRRRSSKRETEIPSGPYMSIYIPTQTADMILPAKRNGRSTNAYGYIHK